MDFAVASLIGVRVEVSNKFLLEKLLGAPTQDKENGRGANFDPVVEVVEPDFAFEHSPVGSRRVSNWEINVRGLGVLRVVRIVERRRIVLKEDSLEKVHGVGAVAHKGHQRRLQEEATKIDPRRTLGQTNDKNVHGDYDWHPNPPQNHVRPISDARVRFRPGVVLFLKPPCPNDDTCRSRE